MRARGSQKLFRLTHPVTQSLGTQVLAQALRHSGTQVLTQTPTRSIDFFHSLVLSLPSSLLLSLSPEGLSF